MNKNSYRKNLARPTLTHPMALATGLAIGALAGCSPHDAGSLGSQAKDSATVNQPLLGLDKIGSVAALKTVINRYSKVTADVAAGAKTVTVANAGVGGLDLGAGDLIMIIQMQGAEIKTDDDPALYGTINSLNNAGKYELATVTSVAANTITVDACGGLKNSYTAAKHVQVVRVPQYTALTVLATGSIVPQAWDGDTGGIVAAYVEGATTLGGPIDVSGAGFHGGAVDNNTNAAGTVTNITRSKFDADGAEQGEGIAGSQTDYQAANGKYGRGAPANGGGGGNSHNGGGGGGANAGNAKTWTGAGVMDPNVLGADAWKLDPEYVTNGKKLTDSSGGGRGGYTFASANKDALTVPPGDASWGGNSRANVGGRGGHPLDVNPADRLFLGGGGGAGDGNNSSAGAGGNGGGLVFLVTGSLTGAGPILANGAPGAATSVAGGSKGNDAPGGGGAGGTIVVLAGQSMNATSIKADGGAGGAQTINNGDESEGPGGGGGGGYIATYAGTYTAVTRTAGGGVAGLSDSPGVTEFPVNGATKGAAGIADALLKFTDASTLPICIPADVSVTAVKANGTVQGGNTVTLTVTVKNTGPQPSDVTGITDSYNSPIAGVTWTCAGTGATCPAAAGTGSIAGTAAIPPSGMLTYTVNVPIPAGFPLPDLVYTANAGVAPGFSDPNLANNTATLTLPMPSADLSLAVTSTPNPATPGQPVTYDLVVTNNGPGTAGSASLQYSVPPGGVVAGIIPGAGWTCQQVASTVTCNYNMAVPPGALPDVKINVVPLVGGMDLVAQSSVTGTASSDPDTSNNSVTSTTPVAAAPGADISVGLNSTPNPVEQGAPIKYAVRVTNNGPSAASGASFQLALPPGASTPTIDAPAGWSCQQVVNSIQCAFAGAVPQGTLPEVDVTYQPDATATSVTATAQALGIGVTDPNLGNNQVQEVTPIGLATAPQADLTLTVTTSPEKPQTNAPIVYTLDVANHGPGTATGAVVSYTIPPGGTVQGIDAPAGWNCAQQDRNVSCWYNGNIDPNTSAPDLHITVLPPQDATSIAVQVSATPKGAVDPNTGDNSVDVNTDLGPAGAYKLAGGGFGLGCSAAPTGAAQPGAALGFLGSLLGLLGLRRRRRS